VLDGLQGKSARALYLWLGGRGRMPTGALLAPGRRTPVAPARCYRYQSVACRSMKRVPRFACVRASAGGFSDDSRLNRKKSASLPESHGYLRLGTPGRESSVRPGIFHHGSRLLGSAADGIRSITSEELVRERARATKPRLRGELHRWGAILSPIPLLIYLSENPDSRHLASLLTYFCSTAGTPPAH